MKEKGIFGIIGAILSVGAIVVVFGVVLAMIGSELQKFAEPNKVVSEQDSLIRIDVGFITYERADGMLVPTHLLKISEFKGGTSKVDTLEIGPLPEGKILLFNEKYPKERETSLKSSWKKL